MKNVIVLFIVVTFLFSGIASAKEQPQQLYTIISGGKEYKVVGVPDRPRMRGFLDDKGNPILERRLLEELAKAAWVQENVIQAISPPNNPSRTIGIIDVHLDTYKELKFYEFYQDVLVRAWVKASMLILIGAPVPLGAIPGLAWGTLKRTLLSQATDVRNFWGATAYLGLLESKQKYSNIDNLMRSLGKRSLDTSTGREIYNNFIEALALYHPNAELINSLMPEKGMELVYQALKSAAGEALSVIPGAGTIIPSTEEQRKMMEMKDVIFAQRIFENALEGSPAFVNYFKSKESVKRYVQSYDQLIRDWVDAGIQQVTTPPVQHQVSMYPQSVTVGTTLTETSKGILGKWKWQGIEGEGYVEFFKDGTVLLGGRGDSIMGNYKFIDKNRLRTDLAVPLLGTRADVLEVVSVSETALILSESDGSVLRFRRVREENSIEKKAEEQRQRLTEKEWEKKAKEIQKLSEETQKLLEEAQKLSEEAQKSPAPISQERRDAKPQVTTNLRILEPPPYKVGQSITAEFTIRNAGIAPFTFDVLTVGGRLNGTCPQNKCPDFEFRFNVSLPANNSYTYRGRLMLQAVGNYHFFTAYRTKDGQWNTSIPVLPGVKNTIDFTVAQVTTPSQPPTAAQPRVAPVDPCEQYYGKGYCTDYIRTKVNIPWRGDAITWIEQAKRHGYKVGNEPQSGAIAVFSYFMPFGHVAWVESVADGSFTASHWNWGRLKIGIPKECAVTENFWITTFKTFNKSDPQLRGFIYLSPSATTPTLTPTPTPTPTPAPFVSPQVSMYPQSGTVGTTFTETGKGFTPNRTATIYGKRPDGSVWQITTVQTDSSGAYSRKWTAQTPGNNFAVWAVDSATGKKSNEVVFNVSSPPTTYQPPTPQPAPAPRVNPQIQISTNPSGPWGTSASGQQNVTFYIRGGRFSPNAHVQYHVRKPDGIEYPPSDFTGKVDGAGNFNHSYTSHCGNQIGTYAIWVIDKPTGKSTNMISEMIMKNLTCK